MHFVVPLSVQYEAVTLIDQLNAILFLAPSLHSYNYTDRRALGPSSLLDLVEGLLVLPPEVIVDKSDRDFLVLTNAGQDVDQGGERPSLAGTGRLRPDLLELVVLHVEVGGDGGGELLDTGAETLLLGPLGEIFEAFLELITVVNRNSLVVPSDRLDMLVDRALVLCLKGISYGRLGVSQRRLRDILRPLCERLRRLELGMFEHVTGSMGRTFGLLCSCSLLRLYHGVGAGTDRILPLVGLVLVVACGPELLHRNLGSCREPPHFVLCLLTGLD